MKKQLLLLIGLLLLSGWGCYHLGDQNTLEVRLSPGINGTPDLGKHIYHLNWHEDWWDDENIERYKEVKYHYQLQEGFRDLQVKLDGRLVEPKGTIRMDRDHQLDVTAIPLGN